MNDYKAQSERTDEAERALIPAIKRTSMKEAKQDLAEWVKDKEVQRKMSVNECSLNVVKALEEAQSHADKLAEALRGIRSDANVTGEFPSVVIRRSVFNKAIKALAAYEEGKQ